ncbi:MAG TPA: branched-chain amino acid ABC transporter permease [Sporichthyaceae bacterium]|nr:branched-chain amino acid ABC transporter permease [Sporichthyaceae bacterium]
MLGFHLEPSLFGPSFIVGIANAGIYSVLAVALVLTFKISRTIGFMHYGVAVIGAYGYYHFTAEYHWNGIACLLVLVGIGTVIGGLYGLLVMNQRIAFLPRITLSMISLAVMLLLTAFATRLFPVRPDVALSPSPFGEHAVRIWSYNVTIHRIVSLGITVALVILLALWLNGTRAGVNVRAISDDVEAARWSGIRLFRIGVGAYAASGAMSCLAGALLAPTAGTDISAMLLVFFRALTVAVVGGFRSPMLALLGACVLSLTETFCTTSALGEIGPGTKETAIFVMMVLTALVVAKLRRTGHRLEVEVL